MTNPVPWAKTKTTYEFFKLTLAGTSLATSSNHHPLRQALVRLEGGDSYFDDPVLPDDDELYLLP